MASPDQAGSVVLVTGATGAIGPWLVARLLSRGLEVRALVRPSASPSSLPQAVRLFRGEITDERVLRDACDGASTVFHLAAKLHLNRPGAADRAEYERVNVVGTRRVVEAARAAGLRRLVFFSTINVYGPTAGGRIWDETSPLNPDSWYAETKAEAEGIVAEGSPAVILRLAAVYGPGMKGNYPRMLAMLRRGGLVLVGDGLNRRTLAHVADVADAALHVADRPDAVGQIYNVTDGEIHTLREIARAMADAGEWPAPWLYLPAGPVRLVAGLIEDASGILGRSVSIGRFTVDKVVEDMAVSGDKIQRMLGFQPQYDLVSGWRQTVRSGVESSPHQAPLHP